MKKFISLISILIIAINLQAQIKFKKNRKSNLKLVKSKVINNKNCDLILWRHAIKYKLQEFDTTKQGKKYYAKCYYEIDTCNWDYKNKVRYSMPNSMFVPIEFSEMDYGRAIRSNNGLWEFNSTTSGNVGAKKK